MSAKAPRGGETGGAATARPLRTVVVLSLAAAVVLVAVASQSGAPRRAAEPASSPSGAATAAAPDFPAGLAAFERRVGDHRKRLDARVRALRSPVDGKRLPLETIRGGKLPEDRGLVAELSELCDDAGALVEAARTAGAADRYRLLHALVNLAGSDLFRSDPSLVPRLTRRLEAPAGRAPDWVADGVLVRLYGIGADRSGRPLDRARVALEALSRDGSPPRDPELGRAWSLIQQMRANLVGKTPGSADRE